MTWQIDSVHSHVAFAVKHMMVSTARGNFTIFKGELEIDEQNPQNSRVFAEAETASINTGNEGRDQHLRSADFFDAEKFPTVTFQSTNVEPISGEEYRVTGDLTMHGVTKSVTFTGEYSGQVKDAFGMQRAGLTAHGTINRKDFGLNWSAALETGGLVVDEKVKIDIEIEVTEKVAANA
jgi:polyisoprenoid-binding protein YceI